MLDEIFFFFLAILIDFKLKGVEIFDLFTYYLNSKGRFTGILVWG